MSEIVVAKAVLVKNPSHVAMKWAIFAGMAYTAFCIYVVGLAAQEDVDQIEWFPIFISWFVFGYLVPKCGYFGAKTMNTGLLSWFACFQAGLAAYCVLYIYNVVNLRNWLASLCSECDFDNQNTTCALPNMTSVVITKDFCQDPYNDPNFLAVVIGFSAICLVHFMAMVYACRAQRATTVGQVRVHVVPDPSMVDAETGELVYSVITTMPQTRPQAPAR